MKILRVIPLCIMAVALAVISLQHLPEMPDAFGGVHCLDAPCPPAVIMYNLLIEIAVVVCVLFFYALR